MSQSGAGSSRGSGGAGPSRGSGSAGPSRGSGKGPDVGSLALAATGEAVNVLVGSGPNSQVFKVYADVFRTVSPWFEDVLKNGRTNNMIDMNRESPRIFGLMLTWVYTFSASGKGFLPEISEDRGNSVIVDDNSGRSVIVIDDDEGSNETPMPDVKPLIPIKEPGQAPTPSAVGDQTRLAGPCSPRDFVMLYIMAHLLRIPRLKNDAIDVLYDWYHPDAARRPNRFNACGHDNPRLVEGLGQPKPRFRRSPAMADIKLVFESKLPTKNKLRVFLILTTLYVLFSERPQGSSLPSEWSEVLASKGDIGLEILREIGRYKIVMGQKLQNLVIMAKCEYHDPL